MIILTILGGLLAGVLLGLMVTFILMVIEGSEAGMAGLFLIMSGALVGAITAGILGAFFNIIWLLITVIGMGFLFILVNIG